MSRKTPETLFRYAMAVDRRILLLQAVRDRPAFRVADAARATGRSLQNMSRAARELERAGVLECLSPGKSSWKRYVLTDRGRALLRSLGKRGLLPSGLSGPRRSRRSKRTKRDP